MLIQVCDVISKWEQTFVLRRPVSDQQDKTGTLMHFTYKNRLYFKSLSANETEKERWGHLKVKLPKYGQVNLMVKLSKVSSL